MIYMIVFTLLVITQWCYLILAWEQGVATLSLSLMSLFALTIVLFTFFIIDQWMSYFRWRKAKAKADKAFEEIMKPFNPDDCIDCKDKEQCKTINSKPFNFN